MGNNEILHEMERSLSVLRSGGSLLYPTDTIWGIGCDACHAVAVERIYRIKERDRSKAMLVLALPEMLGAIPQAVLPLLTEGDRPTTVVMPQQWLAQPVCQSLLSDDGSIGVRIPRHPFCEALLRGLGRPLVSTSANFSGAPSPRSHADISQHLTALLDYCVRPLPELLSHETRGSKIIKVTPEGETFIIRD